MVEEFWFPEKLYCKLHLTITWTFSLATVSAQKFLAKLNWERRKLSRQNVDFDQQKHHAQTMGTYIRGIGAKTTHLDIFLFWRNFEYFSVELSF